MVLPAWMDMATTLSHPEILQDVYLTPILPMAMARLLWGLEDTEHSSLSPPLPYNPVSDPRGGQQGGNGGWRHPGPGAGSREHTPRRQIDNRKWDQASVRAPSPWYIFQCSIRLHLHNINSEIKLRISRWCLQSTKS